MLKKVLVFMLLIAVMVPSYAVMGMEIKEEKNPINMAKVCSWAFFTGGVALGALGPVGKVTAIALGGYGTWYYNEL